MSAQPIGIVDSLQDRRESLVSRLSPAAKHAHFPKLYARPVPRSTDVAALTAQMKVLEAEKSKLVADNDRLRATVRALRAQLDTAALAAAARGSQHTVPPAHVIGAFLAALNAQRQPTKWLTIAQLTSSRRAKNWAAPRHVCIWLVRQLSTHLSLPQIGKHFGGRDHTTVMHADKRAPFWLLRMPELKAAADVVLARCAS